MRAPEPPVLKALATTVVNNPKLLEWLETVVESELKRLPYAVEHPAIYQGRCQMAGEILEFLNQAPNLAAKSR